MADVDIGPFGEHQSRTEEPTDENIPLSLVGPEGTPLGGGGSTWEPTCKQETSFGGRQSQRKRVLINRVEGLYSKLSQKLPRTSEVFHYDLFELRNSKLYFRDKSTPLTTKKGGLKSVEEIMKILGKEGLRDLDFNVSVSDVDKAGNIELQEIAKSTEDLIFQIKDIQTDTDDLFEHPLRELLGLDVQLRSIRGSLKVEVAEKVQLEEHIKKESRKLEEFREYPGVYDDAMRKDITKRIDKINEDLKVRQESIDILKGRLKNQITSFRETIAKVLDKDTSLAEKIRTLFREQGITIASILTAIGMAICVLIEALLPGGGGVGGGQHPPKDEAGLKEWIRNKLKPLASLLSRLRIKAAEALPGIIGGIVSWILNRAKDVVGWVLQYLWAMVVGVGTLIYTYMVMRK